MDVRDGRIEGLAEPPETSDDRILRRALTIELKARLLADQETLGPEFEAVWDANRETLYEP